MSIAEGDEKGAGLLNNKRLSVGSACTGLHATLRNAMRNAEQELAEYIHARERKYMDEICRLHRRLEMQVIENKRLAKLVAFKQPQLITTDELKEQSCSPSSSQSSKSIDSLNGLQNKLLAQKFHSYEESNSSNTMSEDQLRNHCSLECSCVTNYPTTKTSTKVQPLDKDGDTGVFVGEVIGVDDSFRYNQERKKIHERFEDAIIECRQPTCNKQKDQSDAQCWALHDCLDRPKPAALFPASFRISKPEPLLCAQG